MLSLEILIRMRKSLYSLGLSDIWHQLPNGVSENKSALLLIPLSEKKKKKKKQGTVCVSYGVYAFFLMDLLRVCQG